MSSANSWSGNPPAETGLDIQSTSPSSSSSSQTGILVDPSVPIKVRNLVTDEFWREDSEAKIGLKDTAKPKMAESWGEMIRVWPKTTLCIVSNEFCERFSYYGMRTVLTLYFMNVLKYSSARATMYFNGFTVLCYLTPLLGCILADGYIGKFKTIFFVSILYTIGQILLALASTQGWNSSFHPWVDILGLIIIGFGTGGIKPCVCSFGGDQFEPYQEKMLSIFFSAFYFAINAGSMISTFISPMFRATPCLGQDSCYPMAFGIPAALMIVATLIFISGSFSYKKLPPKENIFGEVYKASKKAISNRLHSQVRTGHSHWLDFYFDTHFCASDTRCQELQRKKRDTRACHKRQFIADIKGLLRLLVMYLPAPMFWALYDQQGSRWLIQSVDMDCRVPLPWGGDWYLLPDQMQTLNAVLILLFIPIFQAIIYPLVALRFKITPLRKMVAGGLLAALAFVVSAAVQFEVNYSLPDTPIAGHSFMSAINAFPTAGCNMTICAMKEDGNNTEQCRFLQPNQILTNFDTSRREMFELPSAKQQQFQIGFEGNEMKCPTTATNWTAQFELVEGQTYWMLVEGQGIMFGRTKTDKPTEGTGVFNLGITLALDDLDGYNGNLALCRMGAGETNKTVDALSSQCNPNKAEDFYVWQANEDLIAHEEYQNNPKGKNAQKASIYAVKSVRQGNWALFLMGKENKMTPTGVELSIQAQGGVYMLALTGNLEKMEVEKHLFHVVPDNGVSILWQIPQIAIITAAEILFSITGYEFAYSQAAPSMKSVVQALWLLTTATGDVIIIAVVAIFQFSDLAKEFVFYAIGMFLVTILLALLAIFYYEYNNYTGEEDDGNEIQQFTVPAEEEWTKMKGRKSVQMFGSNEELNSSTTTKRGKLNQAFSASVNALVNDEGEEKRNKQK